MQFEPTTIEHLGFKLYSTLPPVLGELVSNAWDADSKTVELNHPTGPLTEKSEVTVRDYGTGMDPNALQEQFLKIGRNRREAEGRETSQGGRRLTGRKGLGKLSGFGVADQIEIRSIVGGRAVCILLDYLTMKTWPKTTPYEPEVVKTRTGPTKDRDGTEVCIKKLRRKRPIDDKWLRRELARRFTFINDKFTVKVNGKRISAEDRRLRDDCKESWDVKVLVGKGVVDDDRGWKVTGWIGLVEKSSQVDRGVDIFARGKAVELDTMFGTRTTHAQWARAYVVGEVHAEFLDAEEDNIATSRNSATWESEAGAKLQEWGQKALTDVLNRWVELQEKAKTEKVSSIAGFKDWLESRTPHEQRVATRLVRIIVKNQNIEPEDAAPLLEVVKANVEFQAFQELVDELEASNTSVETLLKLFDSWRIIEAREHLKLSDGRLEAMEKLAKFIDKGALEVQEIQPLFEQNLWLVDPSFSTVQGQASYTKLLKQQFPEGKRVAAEDRRMDLLGFRVSNELHIIELKRPEKRLSRGDLSQIEDYVDWARSNLMGTGETSATHIRGRLIVGKLSNAGELQQKMVRLAGDHIGVETYGDLLQRARTIYGEVEGRLKKIAPEYSREARKRRRKK